MTSRTRRLSLAVSIVVALGATVLVGYRVWQRNTLIATSVPAAPDGKILPSEFTVRVQRATQRAKAGPDRSAALAELSRLYDANGFFSEAGRCYTALLRLEPNNPRWPHRYANTLATYGELDAAIALWRRTVALAPDHTPAGIRLGDALFKRGDAAGAAAAYEAVLARNPGEPYAQLGLARIDIADARWTPARDRLERLVAQTDYKLGYDLLPTVYEQLGEVVRATAIRVRQKASGAFADIRDPWLDELLDDCFDANRLAVAGGNAAKAGDRATAVRLLERATALAPNNEFYQYQLGFLHLEAKSYAKAAEHFERSVAIAPTFADGWIYLSHVRMTLGDPAGAERLLATGLQRAPQSPALRLAQGRRLASLQRYSEAAVQFREAIRLRPTEAEAYVDLAGALFAQEKLEEGGAILRAALGAEPNYPPALTALAFLALNLGDETSAREWLNRIRQQPRISPAELTALEEQFRQRFGRTPN